MTIGQDDDNTVIELKEHIPGVSEKKKYGVSDYWYFKNGN